MKRETENLLTYTLGHSQNKDLRLVLFFNPMWKRADCFSFQYFPDAENTYDFIQYNNIPMGATHYKDRIFVTVPRRSPGVASTLNVISTKSPKGSSPSFKPFPDAKTNTLHVNNNKRSEMLSNFTSKSSIKFCHCRKIFNQIRID